jgi:hypothetical protein
MVHDQERQSSDDNMRRSFDLWNELMQSKEVHVDTAASLSSLAPQWPHKHRIPHTLPVDPSAPSHHLQETQGTFCFQWRRFGQCSRGQSLCPYPHDRTSSQDKHNNKKKKKKSKKKKKQRSSSSSSITASTAGSRDDEAKTNVND